MQQFVLRLRADLGKIVRPAFSVIFFTTLVGAAQGLFLALVAVELAARLGAIAEPAPQFFAVGGLMATAFASAGLVASFFHLGHPERAWRAVLMWRTSWLSREVIVLPLFILGVLLYALAHWLAWPALAIIEVLTLLACLALFVCTAMIYISLRFLQEWASWLTLANFSLLGAASGFSLAAPLADRLAPHIADIVAFAAIALTVLGLMTRLASLARNARLRPKSSVQSATGIRGRVVQRSQGFTAGSFNTREFFHGVKPQLLRSIKWNFLALGFVIPAALILIGLKADQHWMFVAAFLVQYAGLVAERWYFFAEANHPQNLYYQVIA